MKHPSLVAAALVPSCLALALAQAPPSPRPEQVAVPAIETNAAPVPGIGDLPVRPDLPPVMETADGRAVSTVAQWARRRVEMKRLLEAYAVGSMPPPPGNVAGRELKQKLVADGSVRYKLIHLSFGPNASLGFDIALFAPAHLVGRVPAIVFPSFSPTPGGSPLRTMVRPPEQGRGVDALTVPLGDQAARAAEASSDKAPTPTPGPDLSDPDVFARTYADVFARGYVLVTYHYEDAGEDTIGRERDGSWSFRRTRVFPAYAGHDWGLLGGWAWGISRVVDYVQGLTFVDAAKIVATGHSRIGKAVLVAGAFDERVAVVAPAGSGAGGTGAYRYNGATRGGREGLADMMRKYPNWFSPRLYQFAASPEKLPFDQHWFIALAAPRGFIALEGDEDQNCEVNAVRQAFRGAAPAFTLTGAPSRLAVSYAPHRHAFTPDDWTALLDFADQQLMARKVERKFDLFPEK
jgi:hypothetical protein